jgi:Ca2+-dependent lipid-binding protein
VATDPGQPLWDQRLTFACPLEERDGELVSLDELDLQVVDVDYDNREVPLGAAAFPLGALVKGRQAPMAVDLSGQGRLNLILEAVDFGHGKRVSVIGSLGVRVARGTQVCNPDIQGSDPDSYVVLGVMGHEHRSKEQWNTREPEWEEEVLFKVPAADRRGCLTCDSFLDVQVFDRNSGRAGIDTFLGGARVGLESLTYKTPAPAPIPLTCGGTVFLELTALNFGRLPESA